MGTWVFVGKEDINHARDEVAHWVTRAYRGLMSVHSVVRKANKQLVVRETSCFEECCLKPGHQFVPIC